MILKVRPQVGDNVKVIWAEDAHSRDAEHMISN
jgi:hypothetical protein